MNSQRKSAVPNPEKELCLQEALKSDFTVEELKDRLRNNSITLFLTFLDKMKVSYTPEQKSNPAVILEILATQLVAEQGKRQASKILGLTTYKDLYSQKRAKPVEPAPPIATEPTPREQDSIR